MGGYRLADGDREAIAKDPHLRQLICRCCTLLLKEPTSAKCGHTFCRSCLESNVKQGNPPVVVCPEDGQEFLLAETYKDEQAETELNLLVVSRPFKCYADEHCEWRGHPQHLERHLMVEHCQNGEGAAKNNGAGLGRKILEVEQQVKQQLQGYQDEIQKSFMEMGQQVHMLHGEVERCKQQLESSADGFVAGKRELQDQLGTLECKVKEVQMELSQKSQTDVQVEEVEILRQQLQEYQADFDMERRERLEIKHKQTVDHNDIQALKEKVEVFASTIEAEQCNRGEQLQGKVQAIEQELEAQKNRCASFRTECETERARGFDTLNMESGVLQDYIGRLEDNYANLLRRHTALQNSHADLQHSHADLQNSHADLQAQFQRVNGERFVGSNMEGQ